MSQVIQTNNNIDSNPLISSHINNFNHCSILSFNKSRIDSFYTSSSLRLFFVNARSICSLSKFNSFKKLLSDTRVEFDVILVNETWFEKDFFIKFNTFHLKNYTFYDASRVDKAGGGVAIYVKNNIPQKLLESFVGPFEKISLKLFVDGEWIKIISYYRPPNNHNLASFLEDIEKELVDDYEEGKKIYCGDMNINILDNSRAAGDYKRIIKSSNAKIVNDHITRPKSNSIIDHIIVKNVYQDIRIDTVEIPEMSDHNAILCAISTSKKAKKGKIIEKKFTDHNKLLKLFKNPQEISNEEINVNNKLAVLVENIQTAYSSATTIKKFHVKNPSYLSSWYSVKVLELLKKKDGLYVKLRKRKSKNLPHSQLTEKIHALEEELDLAINNAYDAYVNNHLKKSSMKAIWNDINESFGIKKSKKPLVIEHDSNLSVDQEKNASLLNEYFVNVAEEEIPLSHTMVTSVNKFATINNVRESIFLEPATPNEISKIIKNLDDNKASGYDGINSSTLKTLNTKISTPLAEIINKMFEYGCYPDLLKIGVVVPIPKINNASLKNDFRPITILTIINKIFEIVLDERVQIFLEKKKFLDPYQYGFVKNSSCESPIMELNHKILNSLNNGKKVGVVFLDISKAYDSMPHNLLLHKMESYGIRGTPLKLFENYFSNRQQCVKIGEFKSEFKSIFRGIAQGSNSGPSMFNIFVNDFKNLQLKASCNYRYADDTALTYDIDCIDDFQREVREDLTVIMEYFKINGMKLNLTKSEFMIFHTKNDNSNLPKSINIATRKIERVSSYRYLGIIFDETMTFKEHLKNLEKKLIATTNLIGKIRKNIPTSILRKIYFAHFHSHLCYVPFVWGLCNDSLVKPLQILQNKALKYVFKLPSTFNTRQLFEGPAKGILPVKGVVLQLTLTFIYKVINNKIHTNLIFPINNSNTRQNQHLKHSILPKTNYGKRDIKFTAPIVFNKLPIEVKKSPSVEAFKYRIKRHLGGVTSTLINVSQFALMSL